MLSTPDLVVSINALHPILAVVMVQVGWEDVGGLEEVKQRLREAVEWPHSHADALERIGAQPPRGVLLYGPPGATLVQEAYWAYHVGIVWGEKATPVPMASKLSAQQHS